jgi:hypothetical protein
MSLRVAGIGLMAVLVGLPAEISHAQNRKPTAREVAAVRECAKKYEDDVPEGERECLFKLVATPCTNTPAGGANLGMADCYRIEAAIWDDLLNENYRTLRGTLDDEQTAKLRAMQVPGSPIATPPVSSTTTKFAARWRS